MGEPSLACTNRLRRLLLGTTHSPQARPPPAAAVAAAAPLVGVRRCCDCSSQLFFLFCETTLFRNHNNLLTNECSTFFSLLCVCLLAVRQELTKFDKLVRFLFGFI